MRLTYTLAALLLWGTFLLGHAIGQAAPARPVPAEYVPLQNEVFVGHLTEFRYTSG